MLATLNRRRLLCGAVAGAAHGGMANPAAASESEIPGTIVALRLRADGNSYQDDLALIDPNTGDARSIAMPRPTSLVPTVRPNLLLGTNEDGGLFLVDTEAGIAPQLDGVSAYALGEDTFRNDGKRFMLVRQPSPDQGFPILINLAIGKARDLADELEALDGGFVINGAVSADDEHVLLWTYREASDGEELRAFVFPTDPNVAPYALGSPDPGDQILHASLSPDGSFLLYVKQSVDGASAVVVSTVDGGDLVELMTSEGLIGTPAFLDGHHVAVPMDGRLVKFDIESGEESTLLSVGAEGISVYSRPQNAKSLFLLRGGASPLIYFTYDIADGSVTFLGTWDNFSINAPPPIKDPRYLFLESPGLILSPRANWWIDSFDLRTGLRSRIHQSPTQVDSLVTYSPDNQGRFGLAKLFDEAGNFDWFLVDAADGRSGSVSTLTGHPRPWVATVSPDGAWVAASDDPDGGSREIVMASVDGRVRRSLGEGQAWYWLET